MGLPSKAAPMAAPAAAPPLSISGFMEGIWESTLINPHGQVLGTHGAESYVTGLSWTVYKGSGWLNSWVIGGLLAADFVDGRQGYWATFNPSMNGNFFDIVAQVSTSFTFWNNWTLRESFSTVISESVAGNSSPAAVACSTPGPHAATGAFIQGCGGFPPLPFNDLRLTYSDASWGWPITFNPYVDWFYQFDNFNSSSVGGQGNNTAACFTCGPNRSEFFIGVDPTWNASKWWGIPLTFKVPTYITVGPANFWTGGTGCLSATGSNICQSNGSFGVFTTGLTAIWDLKWIPVNYGSWYIRGGFQYYDLINNNLVLSETESLGAGHTSRNIWVGFAGLGMHF
jgi:hypothetical protein